MLMLKTPTHAVSAAILLGFSLHAATAHAVAYEFRETLLSPDLGSPIGWQLEAVGGRLVALGAVEDEGRSAYVFDADPDSETFGELLLKIPAPEDAPWMGDSEFSGGSLAAVGENLLVGAPAPDTDDDPPIGAAFLFDVRTGDLLRTFDSPDPGECHWFGHAVASFRDSHVLVGKPGFAAGPSLVPACLWPDGFVVTPGSVFLFDAATGELLHEFTSPHGQPSDEFGYSIAVVDDIVLIGAPGDWEMERHGRGAVYAFRVDPDAEDFGELLAEFEGSVGVDLYFGKLVEGAVTSLGRRNVYVGTNQRFYLVDLDTGESNELVPDEASTPRVYGFALATVDDRVLVGDELAGDEAGAAYLFETDPDSRDFLHSVFTFEDPEAVVAGDHFGSAAVQVGAVVAIHDPPDEVHLFERAPCDGRELPDYGVQVLSADPMPLVAGESLIVHVQYRNNGGDQCEELEPLHHIVLRDARGGPILDESPVWTDDLDHGEWTIHDAEFSVPCTLGQVEICVELNFVERHREDNDEDNVRCILVDVDTVDLTMRTLQLLQCDDWDWGWCVDWKEVALCMEPPFPPGRDKACLVDEALLVELAICNEGSAPAGPFDLDLHLNTDEVFFVGPHTFCNPIEAPVLDGVFPRIEGLDPWTPPPPEDPELCIRDPEECGCLVLRVPVHIPEIEEFMDDVGNLRLCAVADPPVFDDALAFVTSEVLECEDEYRNNSDCFRELYECENPCFFRGDCFDGGAGGGGGGAEDDPFEPGAFAPFDDCCGLFVAGPCFGALPGAPAGIPICGDPGFLELEDLIVLGELVGEVVAAEGVVAVAEGLGAILGRIDVAPLGRNLDERMRFLAETELNLLMGRERVTRRDLELTRRLFNAWDLDLRTVWFEPASSLPAGVNVTVPLGAGIVATFDDVERAGTVVPRFSQWGVRLPEGFHGPNPHFNVDIRTDARLAAGSGVTVEWDYTGLAFQEGAEVRLFHEEHGVLVDRTTESDPYLRRVVGRVGEGPTEEPITPLSRFMLLGLGAVTGIDCPEDMVLDCPADTSPDVTGVAEGSGTGAAPITVFFDDDEAPQCGGRSTILRTWTATDGFTGATCVQTIEVVDGTAPVIADLGPTDGACVWPPNHEMVCFDDIASEVSASDACGGEVEVVVTGCASSDPPTGRGDSTEPDCTLSGPADAPTGVCVRAERLGRNREGRTYEVTVEAVDACGNGASGVLSIHVPHDMRDHPGCAEAE